MKASNVERKHKNALYKVLKDEISFSVVVKLSEIKSSIMIDKKSRQRFKDYALKRVVKNLFKEMLHQELIDKNDDIELFVNIDQQGFATNGLYGLGDGILEELRHGITNFNYGIFHRPILEGEFIVHTKSCVSENDYLIQAADILANRIWNSYENKLIGLRNIPNHTFLKLP
ncbi:PF12686 domain protein [Streptococcus sp. AS20]|nr:PF12686 domain protein [Streptococcus sp. AS20]